MTAIRWLALALMCNGGAASRFSHHIRASLRAMPDRNISHAHKEEQAREEHHEEHHEAALVEVGSPINPTALRPHAGQEADKVTYGIFVRDFYGMNVKKGTWSADLVITLKWVDPRNIHLVPPGHDDVTLSVEAAKSHIWLPEMIISNRARKGVEVISTAFKVNTAGEVMKVERVNAELQSKYQMAAFPFDTQVLRVTIASAKLMLEDLKLVETDDTSIFGLNPESFKGKDIVLDSYKLSEREDVGGSLRKSRGDLLITVNRKPAGYIMSILFPEMLMMMISWTVFFLPLIAPFAMPRVATALIAFLTLMTLSLRTAAFGSAWLGLVESNCSGMMFYNVLFNVCCLVLFHTFKEEALATKVDYELIFVYAGMVLFLGIICIGAIWAPLYLGIIALVCYILRMIAGLGYLGLCAWRLYSIRESKKKEAAATPPS